MENPAGKNSLTIEATTEHALHTLIRKVSHYLDDDSPERQLERELRQLSPEGMTIFKIADGIHIGEATLKYFKPNFGEV